MKTDDDIRAALERIQPSMDLKRKTLHRALADKPSAREKTTGSAGARWPLAVNGVLAFLVLAIIVWSLGEAGFIQLRPVSSATSQEPRSETFFLQSPDGSMSIECIANFYSLAMSSRQGLEFKITVRGELPANEKVIVEIIPSSGTILYWPELMGDPEMMEGLAFLEYYTWTPFQWASDKENLPEPGNEMTIHVRSYLESTTTGIVPLENITFTVHFSDDMYYFSP